MNLEELRERNAYELQMIQLGIEKDKLAAANENNGSDRKLKLPVAVISALAAVAGSLATIGVAIATGVFNVQQRQIESDKEISLEELEFSYELIRTALREDDDRTRAQRLKFFSEIGLLSNINDDVVTKYATAEEERIEEGGSDVSIIPKSTPQRENASVTLSSGPGFVGAFAASGAATEQLNAVLADPELISRLREIGVLNNRYRLAHLLGQAAHETAGFKLRFENLNYTGNGLWRVHRRHFESEDEALSFHRQPERIANRIYANRMGNGDEESGDGWHYRGRGFIQIHGKANYDKYGKLLDLDLVSDPDLAADPEIAIMIAAAFMNQLKIDDVTFFEAADAWDIKAITLGMTGGAHGLADRKLQTTKVLNAINSGQFDDHPLVAAVLEAEIAQEAEN
ncbi:MAG: glycoside hydrolase family 19 protein [Paracoccaceae bacterium]